MNRKTALGLLMCASLFSSYAKADPQTEKYAWAKALLASQKMDAGKLGAMDEAVKKGSFQQITSVLIARGGQLVF